jgi:hypothetical protein
MVPIGGTAPSNPAFHHCLPYVRLPKTPILHTFTLKIVTAMFAETSDNYQRSTRPIPENRSYTLNSSLKNFQK